MTGNPSICVIGSINMDVTIATNKVPEKGETVLGHWFETYPGGKGANQAIAAARLGADVSMIGAVGDDSFGQTLLDHLKSENIDIGSIATIPNETTGVANIILSAGDNRIIVAQGANRCITPEMIDSELAVIKGSDLIVLQLEIPMETVIHALKVANHLHIPVIVNPAPYQPLPTEILELARYITPNEIELAAMEKDTSLTTIKEKLIVTMGELGVQYYELGKHKVVPSYTVEAKDTTGAGDTFNGALAVMLADGENLEKAIKFANATAAISVTKLGAQNGMPTRQQVEEFIQMGLIEE